MGLMLSLPKRRFRAFETGKNYLEDPERVEVRQKLALQGEKRTKITWDRINECCMRAGTGRWATGLSLCEER